MSRTGIEDLAEHLDQYQKRSPGGTVRLVAMLGWENNALATWQLVDAAGKPGSSATTRSRSTASTTSSASSSSATRRTRH
jgi:hypothetical protein